MKLLRKILGLMPSPEIPVEIWLVEIFDLGKDTNLSNRTMIFHTTWAEVEKWVEVPSGDISTTNPIVVARLSTLSGTNTFVTMLKDEFESKFGGFPLRSVTKRAEFIDEIG